MMKMGSRVLLALFFSVLPLAARAADTPKKLNVGVLKMAALTDPWVALKQGFFAANGLDVTLVEFKSGGDAIAAAQSGSVDIILSIPGTAMVARERGFDFLAIFQNETAKAAPPDSGSIEVFATSDIKSLADLAGKTIAVGSLHNQITVDLQEVLAKAGVKMSQVQLVEVPYPSQADVLRSRRVDAVITVDPYTTQLVNSGVGRVISWYYVDSLPLQPIGAWYAKAGYVQKNPAIIAAFDKSLQQGIDYLNADPARARKAVTDYTGLDPKLVQTMPQIGWNYHVDPAKWQAVSDMLHKDGELQSAHPAASYFAPEMQNYTVSPK